jgi:hypothetical protein
MSETSMNPLEEHHPRELVALVATAAGITLEA